MFTLFKCQPYAIKCKQEGERESEKFIEIWIACAKLCLKKRTMNSRGRFCGCFLTIRSMKLGFGTENKHIHRQECMHIRNEKAFK